MIDNPIIEEVHRVREKMLAEFGGDMGALVKDLQRKTEESAAAGRRVVASPPGHTEPGSPDSKKAGEDRSFWRSRCNDVYALVPPSTVRLVPVM